MSLPIVTIMMLHCKLSSSATTIMILHCTLSDICYHYHGAPSYTIRHMLRLSWCSIIYYQTYATTIMVLHILSDICYHYHGAPSYTIRHMLPLSWCSIIYYQTYATTIMVLYHILSDICYHYHGAPSYTIRHPLLLSGCSTVHTTVTWDHYMISIVHYWHMFHHIDNEQPDKLAKENYSNAKNVSS